MLHTVVDFHCKNIYCNDIVLPENIKCDFGADFNQKLQFANFNSFATPLKWA